MKSFLTVLALLWGAPAAGQDVLILGEVHDNPAHHAVQAKRVSAFAPRALVFEMLSAAQAAKVTPDLIRNQDKLEETLDWQDSGWPDFAMYYPIFTAIEARIYGANLPRDMARQAMSEGIATTFGDMAETYGLTQPLSDAQQQAREALQAAAHCDALPQDMLAPMVDIQRMRDALLAQAIVRAMRETGGPVAVITGNGHARKDWGVPAVLAHVAPDLSVHVVGQAEEGQTLEGGFDEVIVAPGVERPDPCLAFQ